MRKVVVYVDRSHRCMPECDRDLVDLIDQVACRVEACFEFDDQLHTASVENHKDQGYGQYIRTMYALTVLGFAFRLAFKNFEGRVADHHYHAVCFVLSAFILLMTMLP